MANSKSATEFRKKSLIRAIKRMEAQIKRLKILFCKIVIDDEIEKAKPGQSVLCFVEQEWEVPSDVEDALIKIYTKRGWTVAFPPDSRGDGGYIVLSK